MIATVNKSVYDTNRLLYIQPSPPPCHSNGTKQCYSPTSEPSPLTLLVKACSNLDLLTSNIDKRRLSSMAPLPKTDPFLSPTPKKPRIESNNDSNSNGHSKLMSNKQPNIDQDFGIYSIHLSDYHKNKGTCNQVTTPSLIKSQEERQDLRGAGVNYRPIPNLQQFETFIKFNKLLEEQQQQQQFHPNNELPAVRSYKCGPCSCGNSGCSCRNLPYPPATRAIHSLGNAAYTKNLYGWPSPVTDTVVTSNYSNNPSHHLLPQYPMYSPFLVPPPSFGTPSPYLPMNSMVRPRLPFDLNTPCYNNKGSSLLPFQAFPLASPYYGVSSFNNYIPHPTVTPSATTPTTSAYHLPGYDEGLKPRYPSTLANHLNLGTETAQPPYYAIRNGPTTTLGQMPNESAHKMVSPQIPGRPSMTPYPPSAGWFLAAEASRLYFDYYYRMWSYHRACGQVLNPGVTFPFDTIPDQYRFGSYGIDHNFKGQASHDLSNISHKECYANIPRAVASNLSFCHEPAPEPNGSPPINHST